MLSCPKCRVSTERDSARFCSECGAPFTGSERAAVSAAGAAPVLPPRPADCGEAREDYLRAVQAAMADGVLDADDRAVLNDVREELQLSEPEAVALETQAKDAFTSWTPEEEPPERRAPVRLEINDGHCYVEGHAAVLDVRVLNTTDQNLEQIHLVAAGVRLGHGETGPFPLGPRECVRRMLQIEPQRAGEHVLDLTLRVSREEQTATWMAQSLFKVLGRTENPANLMLVLDQRMQAAQKIGYGLSIRNELKAGFADGLIRDTNDLLRQNYAERWQPVTLVPHDRQIPPLRIVPELAHAGPGLQPASLFLLGDNGEQRLHLLGAPEIRLGRKRGLNDIVLRCFPRTVENDRRSRLISRVPHVTLALRSAGLFAQEHGSPNGTHLNGQRVQGESSLSLQRPAEIDVGRALRLRLTPLGRSTTEGESVERYGRLGVPDALWQLADRVGLRGVLIERLDGIGRTERYLVVYSWVDLGLDDQPRGAAPARRAVLRIARIGDQFWAESRVTGGQLAAGGVAVPAGAVFPLAAGLRIRCDGLDARVEPITQFGLEVRQE
jgi:hypothetical protein